jgi:predicted esterase
MMELSGEVHRGQPVLTAGSKRDSANLAVVLIHGRGASAKSMLPLADELGMDGIHFVIPQAAQSRWYPQSAFGPIEANEPDLTSAIGLIDSLIEGLRSTGYADAQIALGGFSQGACLSSEYAARNAGRYAGLFVLSGALIGPPGTVREYQGSFDGMPVFIGGSDVDPWIPDELQGETARVFESMGAQVDFQIYDGMPHTVNEDEIERVRAMLADSIRPPLKADQDTD